MDQAVSAVLKDGMSVNKASKIFNVHRKILTERVGGRVSRSTKPAKSSMSLVKYLLESWVLVSWPDKGTERSHNLLGALYYVPQKIALKM